jgi:Putative restriction endonuclease
MATVQQSRASLDDLYRTPEKAELIGGRIVTFMATGRKPARVDGRIYRSLDDHATSTKVGEAFPDNTGYAIAILPSGRESFSPDASYHRGPFPKDPMRFIAGAPHFAAEVRSEGDYTPSAELEMAEKRADYFQAGTEVVGTWTRWPSVSTSIEQATPTMRSHFAVGRQPRPNPQFRVGAWMSIGFLGKSEVESSPH